MYSVIHNCIPSTRDPEIQKSQYVYEVIWWPAWAIMSQNNNKKWTEISYSKTTFKIGFNVVYAYLVKIVLLKVKISTK